MNVFYKLEEKKVVACSMAESLGLVCKDQHVANDMIGKVRVSTVFLCLNHNHDINDHVPLVFETMIFGGEFDGYCERYSTWQDAEEGHKRIKAMVLHERKRGSLLSKIIDKLVLWTRK